MVTTKRTKKVQSFVTRNLEVEKVSVIVDSKEAYQKMADKIVPSTASSASISVSVFKYQGKIWEDGALFMGFCDTLGKGILLFTGENAKKLFQDFRVLFFNEKNKDLFQTLAFETSLVVGLPLESPHTKEEVQTLFANFAQAQKTKNPKVSIDTNGHLYIGGKTTGNFICISGNFEKKADDLSTTRVLRVDVRFKTKSDFFMFLENNKEIDASTLVVYQVLKRISKVKFIGILSEMQKIFVSLNQFGNITEPSHEDTKPKTKVGKTVSRSLITIENKIKDFETSKETCQIFQKWFAKFVKELKTDETYEQFLKECGKSFQPQPETFKTSPTTETTRSRNRQSIQSESEKINE